MRVAEQAPIVGSAFVGGMAQSYLIRKYPQWSWILSLGLIGGGIFLGTKRGWMESVGIGVASSGASGLGTALIPIGGVAASRGGMSQRLLAAAQTQREALAAAAGARTRAGSRYPAPVREEEFEGVRLR